ncbi:DUF300-domain-containing protein [Cylindrobasidium torrendii FP15055 ss-10]|uniref:DUF300-domain-containing protein n=1 Tax=Cylindrobasidium torrendii FP15055 ss-10 TaxID=1314674 RepID=A0A0D7BJK4_9AGAR|nr:DUF300-domain-containing protein [Cylindrobasidium torrendii FP15055 ss-10]
MSRLSAMGNGAGSHLPLPVLIVSGVCTIVAVAVSAMSISMHLRNYRKPALQRMVVRIMLMVPIYGIASYIALFSLEAAVFIDAVRDIYEAFVIYCFFQLLLSYLGGERSLLIMLHGRPPKEPPFPINIFKHELDASDPYTFLYLKRGILQYVQLKPILALATVIFKATGTYNEGDLRANSGYLYVSIVYNISICVSLYCLAMFWIVVNDDLKPFRPFPKFLCVKGILFFSFWQAFLISILVATGTITKLGPYTDSESISLGLTDTLICVEMPIFAFAHMFAFSHHDFIDGSKDFVARMSMSYAFRDAFGLLDVVEDGKTTLRGEGMDYREFEPSEGFIHQGVGRERRIRAGLRYSKGGKKKYWLPRPAQESMAPPGRVERGVNRVLGRVAGEDETESVHAPLLEHEAEDVVHLAPDMQEDEPEMGGPWGEPHAADGFELPFGDIDEADDELFAHAKNYLFGDYNYPVVDVSSEEARRAMWDLEERVLRDERGAWFSDLRGGKGRQAMHEREQEGPVWQGYGAVGTSSRSRPRGPPGEAHGTGIGKREERVVDFEHDRTPGGEPTDVRLRWTRSQNKSQGGSKPRPESSSRRGSPVLAKSPSPLPVSRTSTSSSQGASSRSPLPPDAVDLVVEDKAAEQKLRERKRSDPMSPLRRVYKRGFVAHDEQGRVIHGEAEAEGPRRIDAGEEVAEEMNEGHEPELFSSTPQDAPQQAFAVVQTPPGYANVVDEDNPWA